MTTGNAHHLTANPAHHHQHGPPAPSAQTNWANTPRDPRMDIDFILNPLPPPYHPLPTSVVHWYHPYTQQPLFTMQLTYAPTAMPHHPAPHHAVPGPSTTMYEHLTTPESLHSPSAPTLAALPSLIPDRTEPSTPEPQTPPRNLDSPPVMRAVHPSFEGPGYGASERYNEEVDADVEPLPLPTPTPTPETLTASLSGRSAREGARLAGPSAAGTGGCSHRGQIRGSHERQH